MTSLNNLSKVVKILSSFKPTVGQANELLADSSTGDLRPPSTMIAADYSPIKPIPANIPAISDVERSTYPVSSVKKTFNPAENDIDTIKQQMVEKQMAEPKKEVVQPVDEKKQLFDELVKQELNNLLKPAQKPFVTSSDIVPAFQKGGVKEGMQKLADYLGTSQGQDVLGSLAGMFGNKNMQIAMSRRANRQFPIEVEQLKQAEETKREKDRDASNVVKGYITANSPRGGSSYKSVIDIYHAQGNISDENYAKLQETDSYKNDDVFAPSTINKMLEPYLIDKRFGNAVKIEGIKQPNREKIVQMQGENQVTTKGTPSGRTSDQARKDAADATIAEQKAKGEDPKAKENMNNLMNLNVRLKSLGKLIDSPDMSNPATGISGYGHSAYRKLIKPNETEAQFDTSIQSLKLLIPQVLDKTGKRLSNTEINAIEKSLPNLNDTYENKKAKYNAVYQQLVDRFNIEQGTLKSIPKGAKSKSTGWSF